jgi:hypothetical protein
LSSPFSWAAETAVFEGVALALHQDLLNESFIVRLRRNELKVILL